MQWKGPEDGEGEEDAGSGVEVGAGQGHIEERCNVVACGICLCCKSFNYDWHLCPYALYRQVHLVPPAADLGVGEVV